MRLSDFFTGNSQIASLSQVQSGAQVSVQKPELMGDTTPLKDLSPGQILQGELVSSEKGDLQIKLLNDLLIDAKLDREIPLEMGKLMNFQVRSNGRTLMLTPLQANLSMEGPVFRALEMAGLPVNSATGEMTGRMMQAGLPIDKNSLQQMYREMIHQPEGQISDLIDLHRLGLEVSEENISQMSAYKNLSYQLAQGLSETSLALMDTISQMQKEGDVEGASRLFIQVLGLLSSGDSEQVPTSLQEMRGENGVRTGEAGVERTGTENLLRGSDGALDSESGASGVLSEKDIHPETGGAFRESLNRVLEDWEALPRILLKGELSQREEIDLISQLMSKTLEDGDRERANTLLNSGPVKMLLSDQLLKQWSITPKEVADQGEVEKLYSRLERHLQGILKALEDRGKTETLAFQSAVNMNRNLDFLQQINQMYTYVQLPLRMTRGQTNGELYVFTDKRSLASKEGPITALLHLDMEHLGPLDIYVSMQAENVNTRFTVRDDEMLDFLEAHMEILTSRLEKRGYHMSVQTSRKDPGEDSDSGGIRPILSRATPGMLIQSRGFDVRT